MSGSPRTCIRPKPPGSAPSARAPIGTVPTSSGGKPNGVKDDSQSRIQSSAASSRVLSRTGLRALSLRWSLSRLAHEYDDGTFPWPGGAGVSLRGLRARGSLPRHPVPRWPLRDLSYSRHGSITEIAHEGISEGNLELTPVGLRIHMERGTHENVVIGDRHASCVSLRMEKRPQRCNVPPTFFG